MAKKVQKSKTVAKKVVKPVAKKTAKPVAKSIDPVFPIELEPEASVTDPLSEFAPAVDGVTILTLPL